MSRKPRDRPQFSKRKILQVLLILIGIVLVTYPWISNYLYEKSAGSTINVYQSKVQNTDKKKIDSMLALAREYNEKLSHAKVELTEPFAEDEEKGVSEKEYYEILNLDSSGIMCSVEIPSIDVNLPVYHGTSTEVLEKGVGHLEGTSFPVGGKSTHAVLTGHTGLNKAKLFTDLTGLKKGDQFYIRILNKILAYEVDEINVVLPEDTSKLSIVDGKDYVTLVTCTPYGKNTHRLLVRGHRTKYVPNNYNKEKKKKKGISQWKRAYRRAILIGIGISSVLLLIINTIRKRKITCKKSKRK